MADRGLRLREGRIGPDLVSSRSSPSLIFLNNATFAKVRDKVEESLVKEGDNVRLWQLRIKTAMEQVDTRILFHPKNQQSIMPDVEGQLSTNAEPVNMASSFKVTMRHIDICFARAPSLQRHFNMTTSTTLFNVQRPWSKGKSCQHRHFLFSTQQANHNLFQNDTRKKLTTENAKNNFFQK